MNETTKKKKSLSLITIITLLVIFIIGIVAMASVMIISKQTEEQLYLQERTSQQLQDLIKKLENQNYMTWEDFESKLAEELAKIEINNNNDDEIIKQLQAQLDATLEALNKADKGLTKEQIEQIIKKALEGQLTTAQVQAIVKEALKNQTISSEDIKKIVDQTIESLRKEIGDTSITPEKMQEAINEAIEQLLKDKHTNIDELKQQVESIMSKLNNGLSKEQIEQIIKDALNKYEQKETEETVSKEEIENIINQEIEKALQEQIKDKELLNQQINNILSKLNTNLTEEEIKQLLEEAINKLDQNNTQTPSHTHITCNTCDKCIDPQCDGTIEEKCQGHTTQQPEKQTITYQCFEGHQHELTKEDAQFYESSNTLPQCKTPGCYEPMKPLD